MNVSEYKAKIAELENRYQKVQKQHDREQVIYEQILKKLETMGVNNPDEIDEKLDEIKNSLDIKREKLEKYLKAFEKNLESIEELLK